MDAQFWINAWNEGRTGFHQQTYHDKLLKYFPTFKAEKGQRVLVPLCGKTKDMIWLHDQGLHVHGFELYEKVVSEFFTENNFSPVEKVQRHDFVQYKYKDLKVSAGDFFKLHVEDTFDFIYDRASLVALPVEMRKQYAEVIKRSLKSGGKYLLITYEYDQTQMDGPPFSVPENEVHELYKDQFTIKLVEADGPASQNNRLAAVVSLKQKTYILEKR